MTEKQPLRILRLNHGLVLEIHDCSNRYFGDYHRVCLEVRCRIPLSPDFFTAEDDPRQAFERARQLLGEELEESRTLERMGVPGAQVTEVRDALIESFLSSGLPYLRRPDYPARLLARKLSERRGRWQPRLVSR